MVLAMHSVSVVAEACICGAVLHFTALQPQRDSDQIAFVIISCVMTLGTCALNVARVRTALLRLGYGAVDVAQRLSSRTRKANSASGVARPRHEAALPAKGGQARVALSGATVVPTPM
jgi:hypothetical protein